MSCCNENAVNLGCQSYCEPIDIGYQAVQDGDHFILVYHVNQFSYAIGPIPLLIGEQIIIPASTLNEAKEIELNVQQPDQTLYDFGDGVTCAKLQTIVTALVIPIP